MITQPPSKIEQVVEQLQARFGAHAVQRLSDYTPPPLYATGIGALDDLLGGGLLPGVMTMFQGNMTCGRVTLAQRILAGAVQEVKVYVDIWGTFDPESAANCGVDLERLVIVRPADRREAPELLGALIQLHIPLIVLDDSTSSLGVELPAHVAAQLAQSGSVLVALPSVRQSAARAGAQLLIERERIIMRPHRGGVLGYRSHVTVIEQRGIASGTSTTLDILLEDP